MKLISCHIENYGNLSEKDFTFDQALTQIFGENGYGKTTLASFIKNMFFGMPKNTKNSTERQRFYPFNGKKFGGNLTLRSNGNVYRIERFFDKKTPTKDECKVYVNGQLQDAEQFDGKALLGIDAEAFERTLFITAGDVRISSTESIRDKLNGFADATTEENNYRTAMEILTESRKKLKPDKGKNGEIGRLEDKIKELKKEISALSAQKATLPNLYEQSKKTGDEIALLKARSDGLALKETLDVYDENIKKYELQIRDIYAKYGGSVPEQSAIEKAKEDLSACKKTQSEINEVIGKINGDRFTLLKEKFLYPDGKQKTDKEEISAVKKALEQNLSDVAYVASAKQTEIKSLKPLGAITATFFVLFLTSIALFFVNLIAGSVVFSVSAVITGALAFKYFSLKKNKKNNDLKVERAQNSILSNERSISDLCKKLNITEEDAYSQIIVSEKEYAEFLSLQKQTAETTQTIKEKSAILTRCRDSLEIFKIKYGLLDVDESTLITLNNDVSRLKDLQGDLDILKEKRLAYVNKHNISEETLSFDGERVKEQINALALSKAAVDGRISEIESQNERLEEKESDLEYCLESLDTAKNKCFLLEKAAAALEKAEKTLCARFVSPILDRYVYYTDLIEKTLGEKIWMEPDYSVRFDRAGEIRSDLHLSDGQRCICAFCLRMALTENLFSDQTPFLIMDDPFLALDKEHLEKISLVINSLSQRFQIIYFYCHPSRRI